MKTSEPQPEISLDRQIAETLGYRFDHLHQHVNVHWYAVYKPDGSPVYRETAYGTKNEWPGYELECTYPEFMTDLNASAALLSELRNYGELTIEPYDNNTWRVYDDYSHIYNGVADTLAEAICRAWLAWKHAE